MAHLRGREIRERLMQANRRGEEVSPTVVQILTALGEENSARYQEIAAMAEAFDGISNVVTMLLNVNENLRTLLESNGTIPNAGEMLSKIRRGDDVSDSG